MNICIYYDSLTGNTQSIAHAIEQACQPYCIYCGKPDTNIEADLYFIGSWTDKGNCSQAIQDCLQHIQHRKIAYFGTCGFGGSQEYYDSLYERALKCIDSSNTILGHFYCPGKMPDSVKDRYISLLQAHPDDKKLKISLKNFDEVSSHPDANDIAHAKAWAKDMIKEAL